MLLAGTALVAASAITTTANAQSWWPAGYIAGDIGYTWPEGFEGTSDVNASNGQPYNWTFSPENATAAWLRLGTRVAPSWRVELEGSYRKSDIESVRGSNTAQPIGLCTAGIGRTAAAPTCGAPAGEFRVGTAMLNVLYDFMPEATFNPFLGVGVGWAEAHNKVYGQLSGVPAGAARFQNTSFDDVDGAFAAQFIAGLAWNFAPQWSLDLTGRYLMTGDLDFGSNTQNAGVGPGSGGAITHVGTFEGDYRETSLSLGVRYTFAAPPPPPPVAPVRG